MVDLALAARLGQVVGDGPDDPAARVGGNQLRDHLAQLGALLAGFDFAGDSNLGGERHVDQEPAGERDLRGDARSLGADGFLDDLDEFGLTALQLVGDVGCRPAPGITVSWGAAPIRNALRSALPITVAIPRVVVSVIRLPVLGVLVLFRLD